LRILVEKELDLDLGEALELAAAGYPANLLAADAAEQALEYALERFRAWYEEDGIPVEVFRAVSARRLRRPLDIHRRVLAVHAFTRLPEAQALAAANKRVSNILDQAGDQRSYGRLNPGLLHEPEEQALAAQLDTLAARSGGHLGRGEYTEALAVLAALREPVDAFFERVLVNTEDAALRDNRLNLLRQLRELFLGVADVSLLAVGR